MNTAAALAAEAQYCTSDQPVHHTPCGVAGCPEPRTTTVRLALGGAERVVPVCDKHAIHWQTS